MVIDPGFEIIGQKSGQLTFMGMISVLMLRRLLQKRTEHEWVCPMDCDVVTS
jgi:hypothetical protein